MKKIYFIRHAKSSWKNIDLDDFDRGLNSRGKENAKFMANRLKKYAIMPDLIISSTAKRAKKTALQIAQTLNYENIEFEPKLYECTSKTFLQIIHQINDKINQAFIVAHNPTITEITELLSNTIIGNIPTCAIVCVSFDVKSFKEIGQTKGNLEFFDYPKKHIKEDKCGI